MTFLRHSHIREIRWFKFNPEPSIASSLQECVSDLSQTWKSTGYPVLVMATTSEFERVPASLLASFKHEIVFEVMYHMRVF